MSKIKKVELSPIYLKKDDDVGATYCSFSKDLLFNVGYEKIKDLTLEIDDEYYVYFPTIENGLTHCNLKLPSKGKIQFTLEVSDLNASGYLFFGEPYGNLLKLGKVSGSLLFGDGLWNGYYHYTVFNDLIPFNQKKTYTITYDNTSGIIKNDIGQYMSFGDIDFTDLKGFIQEEGVKITKVKIYDMTKPQQATIKKNKSRPLKTIIKGEQENNLQGVEVNFVADDDVDISRIRVIATKRVIKSGGKTTFNISVFDENNNPIPNVFVELIDSD